MTIGEDRPSLSDFPRVIPAHQCWRNGGVECRACDLEEQRVEEFDAAAECLANTTWTRPVGGAGTWQHTPRHRSAFPDLITCFLFCLLLCVLMAGLYVVGRAGLCKLYDDGLRNCPGYTAQHPVSERER